LCDDLFTPEINSNVADPSSFGAPGTPNYGSGPDWTKDNTDTQRYDAVKAQAVINWIHGFDHAGNNQSPSPRTSCGTTRASVLAPMPLVT
jgi:hypothetical protein